MANRNPDNKEWNLDEVRKRFPLLSLFRRTDGSLELQGPLRQEVAFADGRTVKLNFNIRVEVPRLFPSWLPRVYETEEKIPPNFHKLEGNALCLGDSLSLRLNIADSPGLDNFLSGAVIPYLAGFVYFKETGVMPFGELEHGSRGLFDSWRKRFELASDEDCLEILFLLSLKRRVANKKPCPCGSGYRLGRCHARKRCVCRPRRRLPRSAFRKAKNLLLFMLEQEQEIKRANSKLLVPKRSVNY